MRMITSVILIVCMATVSPAEEKRRTVTVSAQSEYRVAPDEAIIVFSIETSDGTLLLAKAANDSQTLALKQAIKALEIPPESFKVTTLTIRDRRDDENRHVIPGSTVKRSFEIRTSDFTQIDRIISSIADAAGDNLRVDDLRLQVRDQRKAQVEARKLAVETAKEKASHLAELNQMKLGPAIMIQEGVEYNPYAGGFGGAIAQSHDHAPAYVQRSQTAGSSTSCVPLPNIQLITQNANPPAAKTKPIDNQAADKDSLLLPGLVLLNATVKIEFEMLPAD